MVRAECAGFEPAEPFSPTAFKAVSFDHSDNIPKKRETGRENRERKAARFSLVLLMGLGPTTIRLEVGSSIQLSYRNKEQGSPGQEA